jgi:hypothetical protein
MRQDDQLVSHARRLAAPSGLKKVARWRLAVRESVLRQCRSVCGCGLRISGRRGF